MRAEHSANFHPEQEKKDALTQAVDRGINEALTIIQTNFEKPSEVINPENELTYHTSRHTREVIGRTEKILTTIHDYKPEAVSKTDIQVGKLAAAFHDTVQDWKPESTIDESGWVMRRRKRETGMIEEKSAELALDYMTKINDTAQQEIFREGDKQTVNEAILLTVPSFDTTLKTVVQPDFERSRLVPQAVALSDLGGAGMDGADAIGFEALALFDEENLDYKAYCRSLERNTRARDPEKEAFYYQRLLKWVQSQQDFLAGRRTCFDKELRSMDESVRTGVGSLFDKFPQSQEGIAKLLKELEAKPDFLSWNGVLKKTITKL